MCEDKLLLALRLRIDDRSSEKQEVELFDEGAEIAELLARIDTVEKAAGCSQPVSATVKCLRLIREGRHGAALR